MRDKTKAAGLARLQPGCRIGLGKESGGSPRIGGQLGFMEKC